RGHEYLLVIILIINGLTVTNIPRNYSLRPILFRKMLDVHFVDCIVKASRVVQHHHSLPFGQLSEDYAKTLRPGALLDIFSRIIPQHQYVEIGGFNFFPWRLLNLFEKGSGIPGFHFRRPTDRKSTRLNSSHVKISYAV